MVVYIQFIQLCEKIKV